MTFGELKTALGDLMGRTDYTAAKKAEHINRAIRRITRVANLPMMEKAVEIELPPGLMAPIPDDLVALRHMFYSDTMRPIEMTDVRNVHRLAPDDIHGPRYCYRLLQSWHFVPAVPGERLWVIYHALWDPLVADGDTNEILIQAPEAVLYCAASYACTYFMDSRVQEMEQRYLSLAEDLKRQQWDQEVASGAAQTIRPSVDESAYPGGW
ncbi:MAG: hypothetical protein J7D61_07810 [Marichromatium sp.]|nr:hypothetical protein [Marichromatium sp.]